MKTMKHDPQARLDYWWNWADWLAADETIASATITVTPDDTEISVTDPGAINETRVMTWVQGGVVKRTYFLTCHIVTSQGRQDDRSYILDCENR